MPEHDVPLLDLDRLRGVVVYLASRDMPSLADAVFAAVNEIRAARQRPPRDDRPADPPLIKFADGSWIDPRDVRSIISRDAAASPGDTPSSDRVNVRGNRINEMIDFDSINEACEYADELAARVNAARAGKAEG